MRELRHDTELAAQSSVSVLISGEPGVGKKMLARRIHQRSARASRRFFVLDCARLRHAAELHVGLFQSAYGGTLLLNDVSEMGVAVQHELLTLLGTAENTRPIGRFADVRLIACADPDINRRMAAQEFLESLYYRLNTMHLRIPPVRERREDIPVLVHYFLRRKASETGRDPLNVSYGAMRRFVAYDWPGNVKEIRQVMEILASTDLARSTIQADSLPMDIASISSTTPDTPQVVPHFTPSIAHWTKELSARSDRSDDSVRCPSISFIDIKAAKESLLDFVSETNSEQLTAAPSHAASVQVTPVDDEQIPPIQSEEIALASDAEPLAGSLHTESIYAPIRAEQIPTPVLAEPDIAPVLSEQVPQLLHKERIPSIHSARALRSVTRESPRPSVPRGTPASVAARTSATAVATQRLLFRMAAGLIVGIAVLQHRMAGIRGLGTNRVHDAFEATYEYAKGISASGAALARQCYLGAAAAMATTAKLFRETADRRQPSLEQSQDGVGHAHSERWSDRVFGFDGIRISPARAVVLFGGGAVTGGVVMFLVTSGPAVTDTVTPADRGTLTATSGFVGEALDGKLDQGAGDPGSMQISTTAVGPAIPVRAAYRQVVSYRGTLSVASFPSGAQVRLNGRPAGRTPLVLTDLPVGSRAVRLELDRYQPWSSTIQVVSNRRTLVLADLRLATQ